MAMHSYIIDIEYNGLDSGYHPISVTVYQGTKRNEVFAESHGKKIRTCLRKVTNAIEVTEEQG